MPVNCGVSRPPIDSATVAATLVSLAVFMYAVAVVGVGQVLRAQSGEWDMPPVPWELLATGAAAAGAWRWKWPAAALLATGVAWQVRLTYDVVQASPAGEPLPAGAAVACLALASSATAITCCVAATVLTRRGAWLVPGATAGVLLVVGWAAVR